MAMLLYARQINDMQGANILKQHQLPDQYASSTDSGQVYHDGSNWDYCDRSKCVIDPGSQTKEAKVGLFQAEI